MFGYLIAAYIRLIQSTSYLKNSFILCLIDAGGVLELVCILRSESTRRYIFALEAGVSLGILTSRSD